MSERNGDRARFQKNRKRKLLHRQRVHALVVGLRKRAAAGATPAASTPAAATGPARTGG